MTKCFPLFLNSFVRFQLENSKFKAIGLFWSPKFAVSTGDFVMTAELAGYLTIVNDYSANGNQQNETL